MAVKSDRQKENQWPIVNRQIKQSSSHPRHIETSLGRSPEELGVKRCFMAENNGKSIH